MTPDIDIEKIGFFPPSEDDAALIAEREKKSSEKKLIAGIAATAGIFTLMMIFELLGRYADGRFYTAPGVVLVFTFLFVISAALLSIYHFAGKKLRSLTENYQVLDATVTGRIENKNCIFFTCTQGKCKTGIFVPDTKLFKSLNDGDSVKIFRRTKYGADTYTLIKVFSS